MRCKTTLAFVQRLAKRGVRVASVCSGAYVLAEAGLLNGKRATTHWGRTPDFVRRYPKVKLEPDQIFTRDGNVWTSAGITAGIDLALAMVTEDHGEAIAQATARQLVLYHRRSGGQSQFSSLLELKAPNGRFGALLSWARENLDAPLMVEDLADRAGMSARHFARAFAAETGSTPSKAIERLRIEAARERVQSSREAIELVAEATGFGDPERMRRAFIRAFGQPPQALDRFRRRRAGLGGKGAREMPRAHAGTIGQVLHRQRRVEIFARPGQQRAEPAVRRLQLQQRGELRLAAAAAMIEHELARGVLRDLLAMVLHDHGQRKVDPGGDAGRTPDVAVTHENAVRLELDVRIGAEKLPRALPMRGGALAIEQTGRCEDEGAGTDTGDAGAAPGRAAHKAPYAGVVRGRLDAITAGDDQGRQRARRAELARQHLRA